MAADKKKIPDFFEDHPLDPVDTATGYPHPNSQETASGAASPRKAAAVKAKRKAGFYLSVDILERFTRKFHELKLAGAPIENKSSLVELALTFALDDLDKDGESDVLERLNTG